MDSQLPPVVTWRRDLRDHPDLDPVARLVGHVLTTYMDGGGRAQVSRSTLARGCGMTDVGAVRRAVQRLEAAGLLGVDRIKGGQHLTNRYQARPNGCWSAPVEVSNGGWSTPVGSFNGGWPAPVDSVQQGPKRGPTGAGEHREVEVLEVQGLSAGAHAPTREAGGDWEGQERGEGYGSRDGAALARDAARSARAALQGDPVKRSDWGLPDL